MRRARQGTEATRIESIVLERIEWEPQSGLECSPNQGIEKEELQRRSNEREG